MTENLDPRYPQGIPVTSAQPPHSAPPVSPIPPLSAWNAEQWGGPSPSTQNPQTEPSPHYSPPYGPMAPRQGQAYPSVASGSPTPGHTAFGYGAPPSVVLVTAPKSVGVALILTFFFGPLGMLYSTVTGALVMFAVDVVLFFVTLGFGWLLTWPICMIWAASAASSHNAQLTAYGYLPPR